MLVFPQMDPMNPHGFLFGRSDPRGPPPSHRNETTKTPGGRNSNTGHGGSKDLQKAPPLAASTLWSPLLGINKNPYSSIWKSGFSIEKCLGVLKIFLQPCLLSLLVPPPNSSWTNQSHWAYIPNPPLLQVVEWMEKGPIVLTNDSIHMPFPWTLKGLSHPEEEVKLTPL